MARSLRWTVHLVETVPNMPATSAFDPAARFVRVIDARADGLVEFEFAVGEPQLFVEMVMPRVQFETFCAQQHVTPTHGPLPPAPGGSEENEWDWSLRAARDRQVRHAS